MCRSIPWARGWSLRSCRRTTTTTTGRGVSYTCISFFWGLFADGHHGVLLREHRGLVYVGRQRRSSGDSERDVDVTPTTVGWLPPAVYPPRRRPRPSLYLATASLVLSSCSTRGHALGRVLLLHGRILSRFSWPQARQPTTGRLPGGRSALPPWQRQRQGIFVCPFTAGAVLPWRAVRPFPSSPVRARRGAPARTCCSLAGRRCLPHSP